MTAIETTIENVPPKPRTCKTLCFRRRFAKNKLAAVALAFIIFQIVIALFASYLAPYNPYKGDFLATWETPNYFHWLGTDDLGRDVLSRLFIRRENFDQRRDFEPIDNGDCRRSGRRDCRFERWSARLFYNARD